MEGNVEKDFDQFWRGYPLSYVHRNLEIYERQHFRPVQARRKSAVLYELPIGVVESEIPPKPYRKTLKWDSNHVRLPNAIECQSLTRNSVEEDIEAQCKETKFKNRWELIEHALSGTINTVQDFQDAVTAYNPEFKDQWHFQALHTLFEKDINAKENAAEFFHELLPRIIKLALRLSELIQAPIPLLEQNENSSISISQQQVSCLLANAFLCTFPFRSSVNHWPSKHDEYRDYSDINFHKLFQATGAVNIEKIKCFLHYFRRVCPTNTNSTNVPSGTVTFIRQYLSPYDFPEWSECEKEIGETVLHINAAGVIEKADGLLQVIFCDKFVGGRPLGCNQEKIRFATNPELVVSKLFTECLDKNEALFMIGCERYSNLGGHEENFKWISDYIDKTPRDSCKRRQINIVAIDALTFKEPMDQYKEKHILRELNKAYTGFYYQFPKPPPGIATGNWGCGASGGDPHLKALLQIMAACVVERPLAYYTFFKEDLRDDIFKMFKFLKKRKTRICDLYSILKDVHSDNLNGDKLYKYIKDRIRKQT